MSRKKVHYVNNKDLLTSLINYKEKLNQFPQTKVPDYIGICILQICNRLATKPNFSGYTFKDEMIADGIGDCIAAVINFDSEKSQNPFAYFTQIAWYAFLRRIQKEKKENYIKHKNMQNLVISQLVENVTDVDFSQPVNNDMSNEVIQSFENKLTKSKKSSIIGLEKFVEENP